MRTSHAGKIEAILKTKGNNASMNLSSRVVALRLKGFMGRGSGRVTEGPAHAGAVKVRCCIVGFAVMLTACLRFSSTSLNSDIHNVCFFSIFV